MAMEIANNYSAYENTYAAQKQETAKQRTVSTKENSETVATQKNSAVGNGKVKSTAEYMSELAKLVPSVECKIGNTFSSAKSGKTLTINPLLLEKMQNDPEKEKEMKELIKGVESAVNMLDSVMNASGWTVVFKHDYIDENGKYRQIALVRNDFMLNMSDKLREERRKNSEKLIEKSKEKAIEKREELQEALDENKTETEDKKTDGEQEKSGIIIVKEKVEQMLLEKLENSQNGEIYLDDGDMQMILDAVKEETQGQTDKVKNPVVAGNNFDMHI